MKIKTLAFGIALAALYAAPAQASNRCWNTGLGYRYCANTASYEYSFTFADANSGDAGDEVDATMEMRQDTRQVRFTIRGSKCKNNSCTIGLTSQYTSPWMPLVTMNATPADSDILYAPFNVTIKMGKGMDVFIGSTTVTRPDGTTFTTSYFPAIVKGQSGKDVIKHASEADGGDGADKIVGSPYADLLKGGGGGDEIHGKYGADHILGQGGDDDIWGDGGNDYIDGGYSHNSKRTTTNSQVNKCWGGGGNNNLRNCY